MCRVNFMFKSSVEVFIWLPEFSDRCEAHNKLLALMSTYAFLNRRFCFLTLFCNIVEKSLLSYFITELHLCLSILIL